MTKAIAHLTFDSFIRIRDIKKVIINTIIDIMRITNNIGINAGKLVIISPKTKSSLKTNLAIKIIAISSKKNGMLHSIAYNNNFLKKFRALRFSLLYLLT